MTVTVNVNDVEAFFAEQVRVEIFDEDFPGAGGPLSSITISEGEGFAT